MYDEESITFDTYICTLIISVSCYQRSRLKFSANLSIDLSKLHVRNFRTGERGRPHWAGWEWHDAAQGLNKSSLGDWFVHEAG